MNHKKEGVGFGGWAEGMKNLLAGYAESWKTIHSSSLTLKHSFQHRLWCFRNSAQEMRKWHVGDLGFVVLVSQKLTDDSTQSPVLHLLKNSGRHISQSHTHTVNCPRLKCLLHLESCIPTEEASWNYAVARSPISISPFCACIHQYCKQYR